MSTSYLTFYRELALRFDEIGSVFPSSRSLAKAMAKPLLCKTGARRILEVGAGTGPFTREILKSMGPKDELVICEVNAKFLAKLRKSLKENRYYLKHRKRVKFFCGPVQEMDAGKLNNQFDVIVCGLPFSNFTPEVTEQIMELFHKLLAPNGALTFFEYIGMRKVLGLIATPTRRKQVREVEAVIRKWRKTAKASGQVETEISLLNLPPARSVSFNY